MWEQINFSVDHHRRRRSRCNRFQYKINDAVAGDGAVAGHAVAVAGDDTIAETMPLPLHEMIPFLEMKLFPLLAVMALPEMMLEIKSV
jgi:hypothetical protein